MQRYLRRKFLNAAVCMEDGMTLVAVYVSSGSMSSVTGSAEYTDNLTSRARISEACSETTEPGLRPWIQPFRIIDRSADIAIFGYFPNGIRQVGGLICLCARETHLIA